MSKFAVKGAATGTGTFTLESPATNTDRTFTLPDSDGTFVTADGSGNVTISGGLTLTSGTANGVAYLNGSKVLTSGSALTFDGSSLSNNRSVATAYSGTNSATWSNGIVLTNSATPSSGVANLIQFNGVSNVNSVFGVAQGSSGYGEFVWAGYAGTFSEQMRLTSTGLGIGTSSPAGKLHVVGAQNAWSQVIAGNTTSAQSYGMRIQAGTTSTDTSLLIRDATNTADYLTVIGNGNVGIGTGSPSNTLSLKSETDANIRFEDTTSGVAGYVGPSANNQTDTTAQRLGIRGEAGVAFSVGSATKMVLDSSGNVGIGTSSPTLISGYTALEVNGNSSGAIIDLSQGDVMRGRLVAVTGSFALETSGSIPILFSPGGSQRARIDSDGLKFNGDTAAANALDDYEEGTWTPVFKCTSVNPTYTATSAIGKYTKIGNVVYYSFYLFSSGGATGGSGDVYIGNLPFNALVDGRHPRGLPTYLYWGGADKWAASGRNGLGWSAVSGPDLILYAASNAYANGVFEMGGTGFYYV